jgi:hypothetical protein
MQPHKGERCLQQEESHMLLLQSFYQTVKQKSVPEARKRSAYEEEKRIYSMIVSSALEVYDVKLLNLHKKPPSFPKFPSFLN